MVLDVIVLFFTRERVGCGRSVEKRIWRCKPLNLKESVCDYVCCLLDMFVFNCHIKGCLIGWNGKVIKGKENHLHCLLHAKNGMTSQSSILYP